MKFKDSYMGLVNYTQEKTLPLSKGSNSEALKSATKGRTLAEVDFEPMKELESFLKYSL